MKLRNGLITLTVAGLMAVLLCLPGLVIGGGNPPVGDDEKVIGPSLQATIIMGWRDTGPAGGNGSIDAFIRIGDNLYLVRDTGTEAEGDQITAQTFVNLFRPGGVWNIPLGLVNLADRLPSEIPADFGISGNTPTIWEEKDVLDYEFQCLDTDAALGCQHGVECPIAIPGDPPVFEDGVVCYEPDWIEPVVSDYQYVMHATVKLSFIVPQIGKP